MDLPYDRRNKAGSRTGEASRNYPEAQIDISHQYKIGDIYPPNGLPMGVVYEVSADGRQGKIMYYKYIYTTWGKEAWIPENRSSGRANMQKVYEVSGGNFDGYPPFQWVDGLNPSGTEYAKGIWYLPARDEVQLMLEHWKPEIISSLQTINGLSYPEEGAHFGTSSSIAASSYESLWYKPNDRDLWISAANRKAKFSSNFFAVMEF